MKKVLLYSLLFASGVLWESQAAPTNSLPADPDKAWKEVERASQAPSVPKEWGPKGPTEEQRLQFEKYLGEQSATVAEKAREFHTRFPDHAKASDAKAREEHFT